MEILRNSGFNKTFVKRKLDVVIIPQKIETSEK